MAVLWQLEATGAQTDGVHVVPIDDEVPEGFDATVPLGRELRPDELLLASASWLRQDDSSTGAAREFRLDDLRQGEVIARGDSALSMSDFVREGEEACGR
jgi:hypothetical protein